MPSIVLAPLHAREWQECQYPLRSCQRARPPPPRAEAAPATTPPLPRPTTSRFSPSTRSSHSTSRSRRRSSATTRRRRTASPSARPRPARCRPPRASRSSPRPASRRSPTADTVLVPGFTPHLRVPPDARPRSAPRRTRARRPHGLDLHRARSRSPPPASSTAAAPRPTGATPPTSPRSTPRVRVEPDVLYVDEGTLLTSAGVASGLDLCLHILRTDHGAALASHIARRLVVPPHREGGQAQYVDQPLPTHAGRLARRHPRLGPRAPPRAPHRPHARRPRPRLRTHLRPPLHRRDRRPGPPMAPRPPRRRRPRRPRINRRHDRRDRRHLRLRHRRKPPQALPPPRLHHPHGLPPHLRPLKRDSPTLPDCRFRLRRGEIRCDRGYGRACLVNHAPSTSPASTTCTPAAIARQPIYLDDVDRWRYLGTAPQDRRADGAGCASRTASWATTSTC